MPVGGLRDCRLHAVRPCVSVAHRGRLRVPRADSGPTRIYKLGASTVFMIILNYDSPPNAFEPTAMLT